MKIRIKGLKNMKKRYLQMLIIEQKQEAGFQKNANKNKLNLKKQNSFFFISLKKCQYSSIRAQEEIFSGIQMEQKQKYNQYSQNNQNNDINEQQHINSRLIIEYVSIDVRIRLPNNRRQATCLSYKFIVKTMIIMSTEPLKQQNFYCIDLVINISHEINKNKFNFEALLYKNLLIFIYQYQYSMSQGNQKYIQKQPNMVSTFYRQYSHAQNEKHLNKIIEIPIQSRIYYTTYAQKFGDVMWRACTLLLWRDGNVVKLGYCRESKGFPFIKQREPIITNAVNIHHISEVGCLGERHLYLILREEEIETQWQLKFNNKQILFKWTTVLAMLLYNNLLKKQLPASLNYMIDEINSQYYHKKSNLYLLNENIQKSGMQQSQSNHNIQKMNIEKTESIRAYSYGQYIKTVNLNIELSNKLNLNQVVIASLKELIIKLQNNQFMLNRQIGKLRFQNHKNEDINKRNSCYCRQLKTKYYEKLNQNEIKKIRCMRHIYGDDSDWVKQYINRQLRLIIGNKKDKNETTQCNCQYSLQLIKLREEIICMRHQMRYQHIQKSKKDQLQMKFQNCQMKFQNCQLKAKIASFRMDSVWVQIEKQLIQQLNLAKQALNQETQKLRVKIEQRDNLSVKVLFFKKKYENILKEQKVKEDLIREQKQKIQRLEGHVQDNTQEVNKQLMEQKLKNKRLIEKITALQQDIQKMKFFNNSQLNDLIRQKQVFGQKQRILQLEFQQLKQNNEKLKQSQQAIERLQLQNERTKQQLNQANKKMKQSSTIYSGQTQELKKIKRQDDEKTILFMTKISILEVQLKESYAKIRLLQQTIQKIQNEKSKLRENFNKKNQQSMRLINFKEQLNKEESHADFDTVLWENILVIEPQNNQNNIPAKQLSRLRSQNIKLNLELKTMQQKIAKIEEQFSEEYQKLSAEFFEQKKIIRREEMNSFNLKQQLSRAAFECEIMKEQIQKLTENNHLYEQEIEMLRQSTPSKKYFSYQKMELPNFSGQKQKITRQRLQNVEDAKEIFK